MKKKKKKNIGSFLSSPIGYDRALARARNHKSFGITFITVISKQRIICWPCYGTSFRNLNEILDEAVTTALEAK